ncbi:MAG: glycosyltransferase family 39 protein [Opitutaceae bacterium]|nr:glycosyltransferase family 39 protein [Opitutaceae bacterium]
MRCRPGFLIALGLAVYWLMAVSVSPRVGVTGDEVVHLTAGYSYWKFNDYRMHPENGTLPMRLAALPLLAMDLHFPPLTDPDWLNSKVHLFGEKFLFGDGNPVDTMLWRARMMIAFVGAFVVWLTWRWAHGLFGRTAGWMALLLAASCPTMLAHGGLATSDMTMTACTLAALSAVWLLLHRATWTRLVLATVACGAAFLAKMSGVLIVPLIALLLLLRWLQPVPFVLALGRRARWLRCRAAIIGTTLGLTAIVAAGSLALLWAGYGFRFDGFNRAVSSTQGYFFPWSVLLEEEVLQWSGDSSLDRFAPPPRPLTPTAMTRTVGWLRDHQLLPEAYLWGFAHTYKFSQQRSAFFLGEYAKTGWPAFFPVAFLMKTTLPALLFLAAGGAALVWVHRRPARRWPGGRVLRFPRSWLYRAAPLVLFFVLYWALAVNLRLNIGHRHILPTYPVVYLFASAAVLWLATRARRWVALALAVGLALHVVDSLAARPFYLAYFQPLTGGTDRAYRYFVDSSLDWGQGLPDLAAWLDARKRAGDHATVFLTYFGADDPRARGLDVVRFADEGNDWGLRDFPVSVHGGWFAISATHFQRTYLPLRGRWTQEEEALYREIRQRLQQAAGGGGEPRAPAARSLLLRDAKDYEVLQFGRLCHFLHDRTPDQVVGASLLLFRLTDAEVNFALYAPLDVVNRTLAAASAP